MPFPIHVRSRTPYAHLGCVKCECRYKWKLQNLVARGLLLGLCLFYAQQDDASFRLHHSILISRRTIEHAVLTCAT